MYLFVICIFILMVEPNVSQFPRHTDFQKVDDIIFNNDIYKILKPVTHYMTDYFKDFMLQQHNRKFPTKRFFIDHNNFRHYWSGFDTTSGSPSKSKVTLKKIKIGHRESISDKSKNITKFNIERKKKVVDTDSIKRQDENNRDTIPNNSATNNISRIKTTEIRNSITPKVSDIKIITRKTLKNKETKYKNKETKYMEPKINLRTDKSTPESKNDKERTVAKTTFYCPFLGVITMSAFID